MATARFSQTQKAIDAGIETMKPTAAVKNIEAWEEYLADIEVTGVKGLITQLGKLKRQLQAGDIDGEAVGTLMQQIATSTERMAGRVDGKKADKIRALAEGLNKG